jgi:hypothetical protein
MEYGAGPSVVLLTHSLSLTHTRTRTLSSLLLLCRTHTHAHTHTRTHTLSLSLSLSLSRGEARRGEARCINSDRDVNNCYWAGACVGELSAQFCSLRAENRPR